MSEQEILNAWLERKQAMAHRSVIEHRIEACSWRKATGGRIMQASLAIAVSPSRSLSIAVEPGPYEEYRDAVTDAIVTVLISQWFEPVFAVDIAVRNMDAEDPSYPSYLAFYNAACDATNKALGMRESSTFNIRV